MFNYNYGRMEQMGPVMPQFMQPQQVQPIFAQPQHLPQAQLEQPQLPQAQLEQPQLTQPQVVQPQFVQTAGMQNAQPANLPNMPNMQGMPAQEPQAAVAYVRGGPLAPQIAATVIFRNVPGGVMVCADVTGLPPYKPGTEDSDPVGPHGFHIHESGNCEAGDPNDPFKAAGEHWNPDGQPHGNHAGDFPVLFSNNGIARMCFFTNRFRVADIIGKSVMIHQFPDDYRTQPSGDSGKRLACGTIQAMG